MKTTVFYEYDESYLCRDLKDLMIMVNMAQKKQLNNA
jgi:hypothetical protein